MGRYVSSHHRIIVTFFVLCTNCGMGASESCVMMHPIQRHDGEVPDRRLGRGCGNKEQGDQRPYRGALKSAAFWHSGEWFPCLGDFTTTSSGEKVVKPTTLWTCWVSTRMENYWGFSLASLCHRQAFPRYHDSANKRPRHTSAPATSPTVRS
jgi:hypothetical protein